jgi:hypothetical protein
MHTHTHTHKIIYASTQAHISIKVFNLTTWSQMVYKKWDVTDLPPLKESRPEIR